MVAVLGLVAFLLFLLVLATPFGRALVDRAFLAGWSVIVVGGMLLLTVYLMS